MKIRFYFNYEIFIFKYLLSINISFEFKKKPHLICACFILAFVIGFSIYAKTVRINFQLIIYYTTKYNKIIYILMDK
jgi:hypothetical protein